MHNPEYRIPWGLCLAHILRPCRVLYINSKCLSVVSCVPCAAFLSNILCDSMGITQGLRFRAQQLTCYSSEFHGFAIHKGSLVLKNKSPAAASLNLNRSIYELQPGYSPSLLQVATCCRVWGLGFVDKTLCPEHANLASNSKPLSHSIFQFMFNFSRCFSSYWESIPKPYMHIYIYNNPIQPLHKQRARSALPVSLPLHPLPVMVPIWVSHIHNLERP